MDELDGDFFTGVPVFGLDDLSIASLTDELDELVVLEGVLPDWGQGNHVGLVGPGGLGAAAAGLSRLVTHCLVIVVKFLFILGNSCHLLLNDGNYFLRLNLNFFNLNYN